MSAPPLHRAWFASLLLLAAAPLAAKEPDYVRDIKPIFVAHCYRCHGPDKQESELRLDSGKLILAGGTNGTSIVVNKSGESLLVKALRGTADEVEQMPPKDAGDKLTDEQIALIARWIDAGAKYPADDAPAKSKRAGKDHWSFQPIMRVAPPVVKNSNWPQNAIDRFILAELEKQNIAPSPAADRVTLIRRVSLDLTGLLPTPDEVLAFLNDKRPDAYERLVDRLLASPHYGERFGRLWLDQARYADSNGYTNDAPRVIWPYRDWVIDAINADMPFDQFTIEQLAGDLLPDATQSQKIATGFHRNTQFNDEGGSDAEQYRVEEIVDRVATTGVVFMGLTYGCARCHDHKFDPTSHKNFYELYDFFNQQDDKPLTIKGDNVEDEEVTNAKDKVADLENRLKTLTDEDGASARIKLLSEIADAKKKIPKTKPLTTLVLREREKPRESFVHIRGDFLRKGDVVSATTPKFLPALPEADAKAKPDRLALAMWLTAREHPLTARVTVNRHWQAFFGKGIVATENDFGQQGERPSHPELLDWLASELLAQKWSIKSLHRQIVLSATYRQSSHIRHDLITVDPLNRLLARQNRLRLDAELIRDAALSSAGLLTQKMHGPPVFPPQPDGVMQRTRNPGRKWNTSVGEDRYRRGLYTYFWRSTPHPFLKSFDAPEAGAACTRRDRSNTPVQALTMLNDEAFVETAQALSLRLLRAVPADDSAARIHQLYQWSLCRAPSPAEVAAVQDLLNEELAAPPPDKLAFVNAKQLPDKTDLRTVSAWATVARAMLNLDEFITRE